MKKLKTEGTIDITPTWSGLLPWMLRVLESNGENEAAKQPLREELVQMAKAADLWNAHCAKEKK
jgi:hypothetical protein